MGRKVIPMSCWRPVGDDDSNAYGIFRHLTAVVSSRECDESGGELARRIPIPPVEPASAEPRLFSSTANSLRNPIETVTWFSTTKPERMLVQFVRFRKRIAITIRTILSSDSLEESRKAA